jgi:hypothetical protein
LKKIEVTYKDPGGIIWKILPDKKGEYLVIESRNAELRKTILSTLDLSKGEILYSNDQLPKPWWISLKAIGGSTIILQGYKESNSPEPGGLYVFDLKEGKLLWKDDDKIFQSFSGENSLRLTSPENNEEIETDSRTGKLLKDKIASSITDEAMDSGNLEFPILYNEDNIHYKTIADFVEENQSSKCTGPIEYLEYRNNILISFYIKESNKLTNILFITDEDGNSILTDRIMEGAGGVGMSAFFICNNKLIYIKNKTSIAMAEMI